MYTSFAGCADKGSQGLERLRTTALDEEFEYHYMAVGNAQFVNYTKPTTLLQVPRAIPSDACTNYRKMNDFLSQNFWVENVFTILHYAYVIQNLYDIKIKI